MSEKLLRLGEVCRMCGIGKSSVWAWSAEGMFPKPIHIGRRTTRWFEEEIEAWQAERTAERARRAAKNGKGVGHEPEQHPA